MKFITVNLSLVVFMIDGWSKPILLCNGSSYDCSKGCDLDHAINGDNVCGEYGIIYPNECFAVCQVCIKILELFSKCNFSIICAVP